MKVFKWDLEKNEWLKSNRGICFEDIVFFIEKGNLLDIIDNPNRKEYKNQKIYIVEINKYVFMAPFYESEEGNYLITIIPSRKMTKKYLGGRNE
jgi:uncharacterized DUF497 family protein